MAQDHPAPSPSSDTYTGILPLALAREVQQGIKEFLHTSFKPSTPGLENLITDFTADPDNLFRGPYVGMDLPFTPAATDSEFFPEVPLGHRPYLHQQRAFERLQGSVRHSTIVATGTGSGKTECFLLPILDWCRQRAGEPGIKAIVIYPMNALAEDQAKRLAAQIWHNPHLKGKVRAGMYADQEPKNPAAVMRQDDIIRSRAVMHRQPPDILLTNYKMLDNLLIRPDRKRLWEQNAPDTLRYLVVDELHTFDGAQGTDLACLIRRLKRRLQTPRQSLCCVGTSATLGGQEATCPIVRYAQELFDEEFSADAVVVEDRVDMGDFLEQVQEGGLQDQYPSPDEARQWARRAHACKPHAGIADLHMAWFGETRRTEVGQDAWRVRLGARIGHHAFLWHLLTALDRGILPLEELAMRLQKTALPDWTLSDATDLLTGFITLIAFAKRHAGGDDYLPFLTVRVHFWIRELNRMVVSLPSCNAPGELNPDRTSPAAASQLLHSRDLSADHPASVLPMVHCRECSGMAWITLETLQGNGFEPDLDAIYVAYFSSHPSSRLTYLLPQQPASGIVGGAQHIEGHVCRQCLHWYLQSPPAQCPSCSGKSFVQVWRSPLKWTGGGRGHQMQQSALCAYCGSGTGTGIFGVSATSIASTLVSLLFASKANGDPKLLAFGDSVQDVAHRAGFIEARSYRTLVRQTLAHWLSRQTERVSYVHLHAHLAADTLRRYADPAEFAGAMAHVDLMWLQTIGDLFETESETDAALATNAGEKASGPAISAPDLEAVQHRLAWESFSETTFRSQFGRTLENTGCLTLALDPALLAQAAQDMATEAAEQLGTLFERASERQFRHFLLGVLHRMLHDGAVHIDPQGIDPIGTLARHGASWFAVRHRHGAYAYPRYGPQARKPLLPSLPSKDGFAALTDAGSSARWYPVWARKSFPGGETLRRDLLADFYALTFHLLTAHGLTTEIEGSRQTTVWLINPEAVTVSSDAACLECCRCRRRVHVHPGQAGIWTGIKCLNPSCHVGTLHPAAAADIAPVLKEQLRHGHLRRVNARDHTSMLEAERRRRIETQFIAGQRSWHPNLLSTTPTLELGVDIGDLSTVLLYSVPPSQANYVQRLGRAGRREGNALGLTIVNAQPHDLFFWADPPAMIQGAVAPPGLYLDAYAILRRQFSAFALERLIVDTGREARFGTVKAALAALASREEDRFPFDWISFVERQGEALLSDFQDMFDLSPAEGLSARLSAFMRAAEPAESFRSLVRQCLRQAEIEQQQWQQRIQQLDRTLQTLRQTHPAPKDLEDQIKALEQDRRVYRAISRNAHRQDVLELLTDFGILPNYAFPEEGIKLRSVVSSRDKEGQWRQKQSEYVRAASAGLSEFAPGSRFYAEGHRIPVNEIDLRVSEPETWRFCPACPHLERESEPVARACPRCQSLQWRDLGQVHRMVRLKQVHAISQARDTRIGDDHEERIRVAYTRELYPSFEPRKARSAHLIPTLPQPFGFDFLPHVEFQDVNFGRRAETRLMAVAGQDVQAEGFGLCAQCGHALSPHPQAERPGANATGPRPQSAWQEEHARHCPVRRQADDREHRISAFLYHAFRSEAVRIRLPIRNANETEIQSFSAALQLGMRLAFQGKVEHLRSLNLSLQEGGGTAHWLFLYDSVPGGTGYLEQLVRPEMFHQILALALQTLQECVCNQDQEQDAERRKDGCYRCLYGYRNRMRMPEISRDTAIRLIREVLACWSDLQAQDSLGAVDHPQVEESELELRFVAWLQERVREAGGRFQAAPVHQGKHGYLIQLDDTAWEIEPQVDLGSAYSMTEPARADFLLRQASGPGPLSRPIALFLDGWKHHRDRVALDIRQRQSIRDSGRLWVWSLTWEDLEPTPQAGSRTLWDPVTGLDASALPLPSNAVRELLFAIRRRTAAALLVRFLQCPHSETWTAAAGQLSLLVLAHCAVPSETLLARIDTTHPAARAYSDGMPLRSHFGLTVQEQSFLAVGAAEADLDPMQEYGLRPFLYLHENAADERQRRFQWAGALRLFNLLQFLPRTYWLCSTETDPVDFPLAPSPNAVRRDAWDDALQYLDERVRSTALHLHQAKVPAPEVGWDVLQRGKVVAQLEMAWPSLRVGVLLEDVSDALRQDLQDTGWNLFSLPEIDIGRGDLLSALQ